MANQGYLTTHVLDNMLGIPASEMKIELYALTDGRKLLASKITNQDGRCEKPILPQADFITGEYELLFYVSEYFTAKNIKPNNGEFLTIVPVRFTISDADSHYHVPLLVSPYAYSTYRGS